MPRVAHPRGGPAGSALAAAAIATTILAACHSTPPNIILGIEDPEGRATGATDVAVGFSLDAMVRASLESVQFPLSLTVTSRLADVEEQLLAEALAADGHVLARGVTRTTFPKQGTGSASLTLTAPCDTADDCANPLACVSRQECMSGCCVPGTPLLIEDDGNPCTEDDCVEPQGMVHTPDSSQNGGNCIQADHDPGICTNGTCAPAVCGDGYVTPWASENCDDGNLTPGDGCNEFCRVEYGWYCAGVPSACSVTCGDGLVSNVEDCDDGAANGSTPGTPCSSGCHPQFWVSGTVVGLWPGLSVDVSLNGGAPITVVASSAFTLPTPLDDGAGYAVTVVRAPGQPKWACHVLHGMGVVAAADVVGVNVFCRLAAAQAEMGVDHACRILPSGALKCWGNNYHGQLGLGDTSARGDNPDEMGANLPAVDLGAGRTALSVAVTNNRTCAVLDNGAVKCWGADPPFDPSGWFGFPDAGDVPGETGDNLPAVALGTGAKALAIDCGGDFCCALLDGGTVKCWGIGNMSGQLGLGDETSRNGPGDFMGDNLPAVDLGTDVTVGALAAGYDHACAVCIDGRVKCWGGNGFGQLGLLGYGNRGDAPGEMGDALPYVDLGVDRRALAVVAAGGFTCALLDDYKVKCWGLNSSGVLGLGIGGGDVGAHAGDMGDNLPVIGLGTGAIVIEIAAGNQHACALLNSGGLKCWGQAYGLGYGDTNDRGDSAGEMGDALPVVDLGTGRKVVDLFSNGRGLGNCALLNDGAFKCWGMNSGGQLGLGDTADRGMSPGQMGDALPAVDLGDP